MFDESMPLKISLIQAAARAMEEEGLEVAAQEGGVAKGNLALDMSSKAAGPVEFSDMCPWVLHSK